MMMCDTVTSDKEVRENVLRELWSAHSRLKGTSIGVEVSDGTVTLTGTVGSAAEELAALEAARRAYGAFKVVDEIKINVAGNKPRTDEGIAEAVRQALKWDTMVPDERIQVAVSNGWVALQGSVDLLRERDDAERIVRRLEGVRGVYNLIEVSPPEAMAENVREAIEGALKRHAEREAEGIKVSLREGAVDLSGKVHTWAEKQMILGALSQAPGVEKVYDHLSIDPYF